MQNFNTEAKEGEDSEKKSVVKRSILIIGEDENKDTGLNQSRQNGRDVQSDQRQNKPVY